MGILQNCICDVKLWMTRNLLKLNEDKTEIIFFTPRKSLSLSDVCLYFESEIIKPVSSVKNLGVQFDQHMTMEKQVNAVTKSIYFHLRNIGKIRKFLDTDSTKSLVQSLVISRLDVCNSLLSNLPKRLTSKLQRAQNSAARLITRVKRRDHITPSLKELHWLPIVYRIKYKV